MNTLVFIEHKAGALNKTSLEAIAAAQKLSEGSGAKPTAVVLGANAEALAKEIAAYDLAKVINVDDAQLAEYTPDAYAAAMEQVVRAVDPQHVVMSHTYLVRDFAPKLSARFGKGLISDCIRMNSDGGKVVFTRRLFLGKLDADIVPDGEKPTFVTFQSGAFRSEQAVQGSGTQVEAMQVEIGEVRMKPEARFGSEAGRRSEQGRNNCGHRRGIKSKDNIALAEKLAEVLGADLAASRPICMQNAANRSSDRLIRPNRRAQTLHRSGNLRRHPTPRRHEELANDCGYQQRSRGADFRHCRLWNCG